MTGIRRDFPHLEVLVRPEDTVWPQMAEDLRLLSEARNYHHWLYRQIQGALGARIMEVGAGIGTYTPLLLAHGSVCAIEPEPAYAKYLRSRFRGCDRLTVMPLSLGNWPAETRAAVQDHRPDTFVCMNVLEHVEHDAEAVAAMYECLSPGGHIVLILPAGQALYCQLDRNYGHYRRYGKRDVARLTAGLAGAAVVRCHYLNLVGVAGWCWNHVFLGRTQLPGAQTRFFDRYLVPMISWLEAVVTPPLGLSLVIWIRKTP